MTSVRNDEERAKEVRRPKKAESLTRTNPLGRRIGERLICGDQAAEAHIHGPQGL